MSDFWVKVCSFNKLSTDSCYDNRDGYEYGKYGVSFYPMVYEYSTMKITNLQRKFSV